MLQQLRERFRYLKWLLVLVVFMFVVWAFASWTGGTSSRADREPAWAARVNGQVVDGQAYLSYARQLDSTYQQMFREQYAQQRSLIRVGRQAMNTMVDEELLYQAALAQGLGVSPEEVAQAITRDPSFQENGRFVGVERYRSMFAAARVNVAEYEGRLERRLLVDKYRNLIGSGASVSDAEVEREFARRNQKTNLDWVVIDPARLAGSAPDAAALRAWYDAHHDRYMRGEGRTGLYVLINARELAAGIQVSDADVRAAYDRDLASRYTTRDQRRASHILFKVDAGKSDAEAKKIEAKAQGILKRARAGEDFAALAKQYSEDSSAAAGGDLNFFGRGQMVKEFDDASFSLPVGSVSDLVKTVFGYHIIKVTDSRAASVQPFESVRDRIRQEIALDRAGAQAGDRAAALAKAAAGGKLEEAARAAGLKATETGPVRAGDGLPGQPASQGAVTRLLALAPGETSDPVPIPGGQAIVQATGVVPDEPRPFDDARARVEHDLLDDRHAQEVRARGAAGLEALAKAYKTEVKSQEDLARGAGVPGLPRDPAIDRQIETLPAGAVGEPVPTTAGIVVIRVRSRSDHQDEFAAQKDSLRDTLLNQDRERLIRAHVRRLHDEGRVEINDALVASIDRG